MSSPDSPTPSTRPRTWTSSLVVTVSMLLTAVSVSAIFSDPRWLLPVVLVVLVVVGVGLVFRSVPVLARTGMTVVAQFLVGVYVVLILCVPDTMIAGLVPTPASVGELFSLLGSGIDDIYSSTAPTPSTAGFTALLTIGFGLVTMLIDGLVNDLHTPKVAGVLLLLIYIIPVLVAGEELTWWHFAAIAVAFLLLMLNAYLASLTRIPFTALLAAGLALVLGAFVPTLMPEIAVRPKEADPQEDLTVVNPFLDLKADLTDRDDDPVLTYTTNDPLAPPLRLTSVSKFDGTTWMPEEFEIDPFAVADDGLPGAPGISSDTPTQDRSIDVNVTTLDQQYLPVPYAATATEGLSRRWIFDEKTLSIVGNGEITAGLEYTADYTSVEPSASDLQDADPVETADFETELALPDDTPAIVGDTADEVTADAKNQWEAAVALQAYFRGGDFEYSLDAPEDASGSALEDFLAQKKGYCVQFSAAMAAMARTQGIPARIGVGFAAGEETGDGEYSVSMQEAHAWPELYFEGMGWVRFEPTPGGPAGTPPPWSVADGESETEESPSASPSRTTEEASPEASGDAESQDAAESTEAAAPSAQATSFAWLWAVLAVLVLAFLVLVLPNLLRASARRRRLAAPLDPERVWAELRATSVDVGAPLPRTETVATNAETFASRLSGPSAEHVALVARAVDEKRYAGAVATGLDPEAVRTALEEYAKAERSRMSGVRALVSRVWPASLFTRG